MTNTPNARMLNCGYCYEENGQEVHPHPECPIGRPLTATPEQISAILRSDDTSPEAPYPCQIGVYCDDCSTTVERDYIVNDLMSKPERLEVARTHLRAEGWQCDADGDYCPTCRESAP